MIFCALACLVVVWVPMDFTRRFVTCGKWTKVQNRAVSGVDITRYNMASAKTNATMFPYHLRCLQSNIRSISKKVVQKSRFRAPSKAPVWGGSKTGEILVSKIGGILGGGQRVPLPPLPPKPIHPGPIFRG